ncbi:MAG: hypothetical protein K2N37_05905 [Lachnospiraceae bacterium]|nr:hypothetical protein [Lachnospiraceae bacterium]
MIERFGDGVACGLCRFLTSNANDRCEASRVCLCDRAGNQQERVWLFIWRIF